MDRFVEPMQSLESAFYSLTKEFERQLQEIECKRDFLVGRIIAEETKTFDMCEHEKLGCAIRWYKVKNKEIVRKGYRYQLGKMFESNDSCFAELKKAG